MSILNIQKSNNKISVQDKKTLAIGQIYRL